MFRESVEIVSASSPGFNDIPDICILVKFCSIERMNLIRFSYLMGVFSVILTVVDLTAGVGEVVVGGGLLELASGVAGAAGAAPVAAASV